MTSAAPAPRPAPRALDRPRHAVPVDERYRRARGWALGVLGVGTVALFAWLALVLAASWLAGAGIGLLRPDLGGPPDVGAVCGDALPALLAGWCTGLAALAVVVRTESVGPRLLGVGAGLVGCLVGCLALAMTGSA